MKQKNPALFEIIDVIHLKRNSIELNTVNKSCYCLSCRISGKSLFFYKGNSLLLKKGDVLYVPKNCSYSQKTDGEEIICFHLEAYGDLLNELSFSENLFPDDICHYFEEAEKLWKQKEDNYYYSCLSILYKILSICNINFTKLSVTGAEIIQDSLDYLNANIFDSQLSVNDLYKKSRVGRSRFNEIFKELYGVAPRKYIYSERINKAKLLLKSGNYTNEEISYLCGFSNEKYFYVVFKKVTGKTTKEYKMKK